MLNMFLLQMHQINLQHTTMNHPDIPQVTNEIKQCRNQEAVSRIVYTVSGFSKALRGYLFPPAEIQKRHLFICLTLNESKIDAIVLPLLTVTQKIFSPGPGRLKVTIDSTCKKSRHGKLALLSKKYLINCVIWILILWAYFPSILQATSKCQNAGGAAPAQSNGKILVEGAAANWAGSPGAVTADNGHSFAKALEHVIAVNANNKFISYNNHPPDVPKVKTKSSSKGVLMMDITGTDAAAWIVHTVPGFPKARTGYLFPPAEVQKGHLLICLTIKENQIDTIALTLRFVTPLIYYNDIPDTEVNSRPNLKKLVSSESRILPPLAVTKDTTTAADVGLKVTIYSKGEKSRYEIYRKILLKKLKSTVKVWTARDNKLKSDCRIPGRNIRLVTSPISVNGDQSTLENDVSQWLVTETGNKFCAVDKPYQKSQTMEPTMAVCIDDATISTRFKEIAQNKLYRGDSFKYVLTHFLTYALKNEIADYAISNSYAILL
ncbi:Plancitoxin-1 [Trichinella sp. T9]|nr:Plancitoxin-1 [Trichinella sp. T9]